MVTFDIKSLVYQRLQPFAKAAGFKLLIIDKEEYETWDQSLQKKAASFGISDDEVDALKRASGEYSCIAVLKHSSYFGPSEVASRFAKLGVTEDDVHMLQSKNAKKHPAFGDFDVRNKLFIYWIPIDIYGFGNDVISEDIEQFDGIGSAKVKRIKPISFRGISGFIVVKDLLDAIENAWPGQEDSIFNFGQNGKIYGQVNNAYEEDGTCMLTLAPYKNGSRSMNLSVDGASNEPIRFKKLKEILSRMNPDATVFIKMKDPFGRGPSFGRIVKNPVDYIDVDSVYGVFLRSDFKHQEESR